MSHQAVSWALRQPIKPSPAKFILMVLAHLSHSKEAPWLAFSSVASLVETTGQDRKTVFTNLERLVKSGWIRDTGERTGRTNLIPVYELTEAANGTETGTVKQSQIFHQTAPESEPLNGTNTGTDTRSETVPDFPSNGTGFPSEQSQISHQTVPNPVPQRDKENKEEKQEKNKTHARKRAGFDAMEVELPDWLPTDAWHRWVKHRREIRKVLTEETTRQQIAKLDEWAKAGWKPQDVIDNAIGQGWQGLYLPKEKPRNGPDRTNAHGNFSRQDYHAGVAADGSF